MITLIGVIALSLVIWFGGPLIAVAGYTPLASPVVRLVVVMVLLLLWGLNNLRLQMKANKENEGLIEGLSEIPKEAAAPADAGVSEEELQLLKERFRESMQVLKKAKLSSASGEARLYELPWYIIIGPPGSGKTTALVNSDLHFPLADRFGKEAVKGVGGTRNCDWWFTDEAVLVDTAGRYTTQDTHEAADAAAWGGFLDLLRKHRRRRPINGVIVAVSVSDLMQQTEYERNLNAQAIRRRIQELNQKLGISFPIYLLLTKCDLIAGFVEFFDDLGRDERAQVWGLTFPVEVSNQPDGPLQAFEAEFDALLARLNERLLWRLHHERDVRRRNLILSFPQQVANLKPVISEFIRDVFRESRYEERALLRGAYFTSGTQEGTPIDRLMGALSRTFGVDPRAAVSFSGPGKSFFLTRLFTEVIFPEAEITGAGRKAERRRSVLQVAAYAAAIIVTIGSALAFALSFTRNEAEIQTLDERIAAFEPMEREVRDPNVDVVRKLPGLAALRKATDVYRNRSEGTPWIMDFGLYQGDKLGDAADAAYNRVLQASLLPHVQASLEGQMQDDSRGVGPVYEAFSIYLSLADPDSVDRDRLRTWMVNYWERRFAGNAAVRDELRAHLDFMLERRLAAVDLNQFSIAQAKRIVCRASPAEQVLRRILEKLYALDLPPFQLDYFGSTARKVFVSRKGRRASEAIPGHFTRAGYDAFLRVGVPEIPKIYADIREVCALQTSLSPAGIADLTRKVEDLYFAEYGQRWENLRSDIALVNFTDIAHAAQVLGALSGPQSPLRDLLVAIEKNTALGVDPDAAGTTAGGAVAAARGSGRKAAGAAAIASALGGKAPGSSVRRRFRPLHALVRPVGDNPPPLAGVLAEIAELREYMAEIDNAPDTGEAAVEAAKKRISRKGKDLMGRLRDESTRQVEPVKSVLRAAARNSWATIMQRARVQIDSLWKETVLPAYRRLDNRFPLFPNAREEAAIADFATFFRPKGVLDEFFEANLAPFVKTGRRWKLYKVDGLTIGISSNTLAQLKRARSIAAALFPNGAQSPTISFSLRPVYLDARANRFTLTMDGQTAMYRHGPARSINMVWPGPERPGHVRIAFTGREGTEARTSEEGDWAWFRVLARGNIERTQSPDRVRVSFKAADYRAVYELRTQSLANPFTTSDLYRFRAPANL